MSVHVAEPYRDVVDLERMKGGDQLLILNSPEDSAASFARDKAACQCMSLNLTGMWWIWSE